MGPSVKFVSAIKDAIFNKKNGGKFFFEKMPNWGGGPRGVWQKTTFFPFFFFLATFPNLNSFKSKYLTLKEKVSALQLEVGAKEDFILLVRNNLQDPSIAHQSSTAGKYMCYGVGPIAENFYTTGIKFEKTEMIKMLNNYDYAQCKRKNSQ